MRSFKEIVSEKDKISILKIPFIERGIKELQVVFQQDGIFQASLQIDRTKSHRLLSERLQKQHLAHLKGFPWPTYGRW